MADVRTGNEVPPLVVYSSLCWHHIVIQDFVLFLNNLFYIFLDKYSSFSFLGKFIFIVIVTEMFDLS